MSELKKNALYIGCGDPRLWYTHTEFRNKLIEERGLKLYNLLVPGSDEGAHGNHNHHDAEVFFSRYFYTLTGFEELHYPVHEDCAGCKATVEEHMELAVKEAKRVAKTIGFHGTLFVYIQHRPGSDDYGLWESVEIYQEEVDFTASQETTTLAA